jgi:hypothetical protein
MISKTVSLSEATKSTTAIRFGISNEPSAEVLERMKVTAARIIDPVRQRFPRSVVSSFYRSPALNRKMGGSKTSQHVTGEAVDLDSPDNVDNLAIFNFIKDELTFDQLIFEYPDVNGVPNWVHASIRQKDNRGQVLVKLKDKYIPFGEYQIGMI